MLSVECWMVALCAMLNVECWMLNGRLWRCWMIDCWMVARCAMLNVECWMLNGRLWRCWMIDCWITSLFIPHSSSAPPTIQHSTFHIRHCACAIIQHSTFHIRHFFPVQEKNFPVERVIFCFCFTIAKLRNVGRSCNSCGGVAGRLWRSSLYECWMCHYVIMSLCH